MTEWTDRLKSRKFLLAVFGALLALLTDVFGIPIEPSTWQAITTFILGYMGIEGAADVIERFKKDG